MADTLDITDLLVKLSSSADPIMYQYFKNLQNRTLIFNQEVDSSIVELAVLPLLEWDNDGSGKEITIIANSPGGEVYNGLVLCNVIEKLKTPTTIIGLGYMYSMGSLIMMAGYNNPNVKRKCYEFSTSLIHDGNAFVQGTGGQVKDFFNFNNKYEEKIKNYILSHTKITPAEYETMDRKEWYMTSNEMLNYGLVDEII